MFEEVLVLRILLCLPPSLQTTGGNPKQFQTCHPLSSHFVRHSLCSSVSSSNVDRTRAKHILNVYTLHHYILVPFLKSYSTSYDVFPHLCPQRIKIYNCVVSLRNIPGSGSQRRTLDDLLPNRKSLVLPQSSQGRRDDDPLSFCSGPWVRFCHQ